MQGNAGDCIASKQAGSSPIPLTDRWTGPWTRATTSPRVRVAFDVPGGELCLYDCLGRSSIHEESTDGTSICSARVGWWKQGEYVLPWAQTTSPTLNLVQATRRRDELP
jgi:hypothetical protein